MKQVQLIDGKECIDHVHMYVAIPPKMCVSEFMSYLKDKSTLMLFDRHPEYRPKWGDRNFWARGYFVSTVGNVNEETCEFGYNLERTCDEIRPEYYHVESCQQTVPEAITAFLEGKDFEDVLRIGVSLGGDSDTLTAIAASIAEAYFGIPEVIRLQGVRRVPGEFIEVLNRFGDITGRLLEADKVYYDNKF